MSSKQKSHLQGERGQAFADKIRNIPNEQILCVSLDISKYFHTVVIHNSLGEIVKPTFEIDIFHSGYEQLCTAIEQAVAHSQAQVVLVGMEPTGHYFENLARSLQKGSRPVILLNSYAVKQNREQRMMRRQKSDPIDAAAIGDLLRRGEGTPYRPLTDVYLHLQHLSRVRLSKVKIQTILKNQIIGHLDRIFPGLILSKKAQERYTPLYKEELWSCQTLQHLIRVCPDPHQLAAMSEAELIAAFQHHHYKMGPKTAQRIISYAQKVLLPDPQVVAIRCELLQYDLHFLDEIDQHLASLSERLWALLQHTPYLIWTKLQGISPLQVANLAAALGPPEHYAHAKHVFGRSGLGSGRNDSGSIQRQGAGSPITKAGDVYLRRALMEASRSLTLHQPILGSYYARLKLSKPDLVARVATTRKTTAILWAVLRDQHSTSLILKRGVTM